MSAILVPSFTLRRSKPDANGSNVPRWPTFLADRAVLTRCTTCAEEGPSALSIKRIPLCTMSFCSRPKKDLTCGAKEKQLAILPASTDRQSVALHLHFHRKKIRWWEQIED